MTTSTASSADLSALDTLPTREQPVPVLRDRAWIATTVAAVSTAGAAVTHLQAGLDHITHGAGHLTFFGVVAAAQVFAATQLVLRPRPVALGALLAGTVALIVFYVLAHTTLLPFLMNENVHGGDRPEPSSALGVVATALQLLTVLAVCALLPARARSRATTALALVGVALGLAWFAGWL